MFGFPGKACAFLLFLTPPVELLECQRCPIPGTRCNGLGATLELLEKITVTVVQPPETNKGWQPNTQHDIRKFQEMCGEAHKQKMGIEKTMEHINKAMENTPHTTAPPPPINTHAHLIVSSAFSFVLRSDSSGFLLYPWIVCRTRVCQFPSISFMLAR